MAIITWLQEGVALKAASFEFAMSNGVLPSRGKMALAEREFRALSRRGDARIVVEFDGGVPPTDVNIRRLYVDSYTVEKGAEGTGAVYTVHLLDRRSIWRRFGEITKTANVLLPGGGYNPASLNDGKPYTWKELVLECVSAMGETAELLDAAAIPDEPVKMRNVRWVAKRPAHALAELLDSAGYTLAMRYDGKFRIVAEGSGELGRIDARYGPNRRTGSGFPAVPEAGVVTGARILDQRTVRLEAAALDTRDNCIKALGDVSYLQGIDIGRAIANGFAELRGRGREAALATAGRIWRIPKTGLYADDQSSANAEILPVLNVTAERAKRGGFRPARLMGAYFEKGCESPALKREYRNAGSAAGLVPFEPGWAVVDAARGLVRTARVCGVLADPALDALPETKGGVPSRVELVPPVLTFAYFSKERYKYELACESMTDEEGTLSILREDLLLWSIEGKHDAERKKELDAFADKLLRNALEADSNPDAEHGIFGGCHAVENNGAVQTVSWRADYSQGSTSYFLNLKNRNLSASGGEFENFLIEAKALEAESSRRIPDDEAAFVFPQAMLARPEEHLRLANTNKRGPIPIRTSDALEKKNISTGHSTDDECAVFSELDDYDHEHEEPALTKRSPAERFNWNWRDHSAAGGIPRAQDRVWAVQLISDDRYVEEDNVNRSTEIIRLCDEKKGDLDELVRVRASNATGNYRAMLHLNDGGDGTALEPVDAGYITDVPAGLRRRVFDDKLEIAPVGRVSQWGFLLLLTDDDAYGTTKDGDKITLPNIFHKAHFHYDENHDGRIYFTLTNAAGAVAPQTGILLKGEMACDSAVANANTYLGIYRESGEWRPCIRQLNAEYIPYSEHFGSPGETAPGTDFVGEFKALSFPSSGATAESFKFTLPEVPDGFGISVELFYPLFLATSGSDTVNFDISHRVVAPGESLTLEGDTGSASVQILGGVDAGVLVKSAVYTIPAGHLGSPGETVVFKIKRTPGSGGDDYSGAFKLLDVRFVMAVAET